MARRDHGFRHSGKLVKVSVGLRARPNVVGQTGSSNCDGAQECEALRTRRGKGCLASKVRQTGRRAQRRRALQTVYKQRNHPNLDSILKSYEIPLRTGLVQVCGKFCFENNLHNEQRGIIAIRYHFWHINLFRNRYA